MKISKGAKVGIMIEIIVLGIIILFVLFNRTIPSVLSWIFVAGLVVTLASTLVTLSKRNDKR
jgi:small-conductance mechanosensitive channel